MSPSTPRGAGPQAPLGTGSSSLEFDRVVVDDVSRHFGRRRAVSRVSFVAPRGAIVGLLGPNGAGKSTVLAMLATILRPSTGAIRYGTLDSVSGSALRARIGVLGHDLFLYPELTAHENLAFFASLYGLANADTAARSALDRAGLADRGGDLVTSFSRGMRQRVALERALIHEPRLVLLDEPFTGLDDASAAALVERLRGLRHAGAIVILATHDLDLAESLLDEAVFLREGRMVQAVSRPEGLRSAYRRVMESRETGPATR
ncbi:MAG TPA: ABC transporter ATP-binding protein [Vicinamibacterales bacterium]|nr:ABC transporter ATP-binding protein [Vicinamibacterales bacterium]